MRLRAYQEAYLFYCAIVLGIPVSESTEAIAERSGGTETEVLFESRGVSIRHRYITCLHRHQFLMGFKIIIGRKHLGCNKFLLQDNNEIEQVLGVVVADIINGIRRIGEHVLE